ncbi:MAG: FAD-binding oxidoreductase [Gammaproteobacteria bacterium]|nr:FAD-binding oxidoreductase [Gammaproteobacteria bacterium]
MTEYPPQDANENSLWSEGAVSGPVIEPLTESLSADVLVVGGGYTGLSSALHLAEKGISVVLLEARSIGFGGSGRNAGLVNAGIWKTPDDVQKLIGADAARRFNLALRDSPVLVFDLVERFDMQCHAKRCGTVHIAHRASGMDYLRDRCRQLQDLGAAVELIDGDRTHAISGSSVYRHGGILDPGAGTIQPLSYARSLALAAIDQGARLFQQSGIKSLARRDDRWLAKTDGGEVSAEQVIIATNAYADNNSEKVRESILPVFIFHCATPPLPADIAASIIPQRHGLWDTDSLLTSSRIDHDGRLVMSAPGRLPGFQRTTRKNWLMRKRDHLYPQLKGTPWAYQWSGQIGVTSTKILRVQLLAPGLFAPAGYNGRGIGVGTVMGKQLAETIASGNRDDFPFPIEALYREKWSRIRAGYYDYGTLALQFFSGRG